MKHRKLYWVTTPQNEENWFVVAKSKSDAESFHDHGEGFLEGYSSAKLVTSISSEILKKLHTTDIEDWPSHELLVELGFRFIEEDFPRIVSYKGQLYCEGKSNLKILEEKVAEHCGLYVIKAFGTEKYKIGFTKDLKARLRTFRTALPVRLDLVYYVWTINYVWLEKLLHQDFKEKRVPGERFELDIDDLYILETILGDLNDEFHFINVKKIADQIC